MTSPGQPLVRTIAALALPALGVLAAEPLYLLFDTAVVGRLGALSLAGLAIGGLVVSMVSTQLTFLSYGTTARSARFHGAGDRAAAVHEGVQATWLALGLGVLIVAAVQVIAGPLIRAVAGDSGIAGAALPWLRVAIFAAPVILVSLAGNGWLRGVQDTVRPLRYVVVGFAVSAVLCPLLVYGWLGMPRWGLAGSAVANVAGQWLSGLLFCRALLVEGVSLRPDPQVLRLQVVMGRDLMLRTAAFQACFLSAAPLMAPITGLPIGGHFGEMSGSSVVLPSSLRSSPAQNTGSAPVTMTTSTSSSASALRSAAKNWVRSAAERALRDSGRLNVRVRTRSVVSISRTSTVSVVTVTR